MTKSNILSDQDKMNLQEWANDLNLDDEEKKGREVAQIRIIEAEKPNQESLDLSDLGLTSLPEMIGSLTWLKRFDLDKNRLQTFPKSFSELTLLESLDLSNNLLETLPESFGNLTSLEILILNDNRLEKLPDSMVSLTNLLMLYLPDNDEKFAGIFDYSSLMDVYFKEMKDNISPTVTTRDPVATKLNQSRQIQL